MRIQDGSQKPKYGERDEKGIWCGVPIRDQIHNCPRNCKRLANLKKPLVNLAGKEQGSRDPRVRRPAIFVETQPGRGVRKEAKMPELISLRIKRFDFSRLLLQRGGQDGFIR